MNNRTHSMFMNNNQQNQENYLNNNFDQIQNNNRMVNQNEDDYIIDNQNISQILPENGNSNQLTNIKVIGELSQSNSKLNRQNRVMSLNMNEYQNQQNNKNQQKNQSSVLKTDPDSFSHSNKGIQQQILDQEKIYQQFQLNPFYMEASKNTSSSNQNLSFLQTKQEYQQQLNLQKQQELNKSISSVNNCLGKKMETAQLELDECHEKIAKLVTVNNNQNQQIDLLKQKIEQQEQIIKQNEEKQLQNLEMCQKEINEKDVQMDELSKYVSELEHKIGIFELSNKEIHKENRKLNKNLQKQIKENHEVNQRLSEAESNMDQAYQFAQQQNEVEVQKMQDDIERLIQLLKTTKEFKEFSLFCESSNDVRFLKRIHQVYKGNEKRTNCCKSSANDNYKNSKANKNKVDANEQLFWIPKDTFKFLSHFTIKNQGKIQPENIEEILFGLNKYFKNREDARITKMKKKYENEIEKLKRDLDKQTPFDEIQAQRKLIRLKQKILSSNTQNQNDNESFVDMSQIFVCDKPMNKTKSQYHSKFNTLIQNNGVNDKQKSQQKMYHYKEVLQLATDYEAEIRKQEDVIFGIQKQMQEQSEEQTIQNKLVYMEGTLWVIKKIQKELTKYKLNISKTQIKFSQELEKILFKQNNTKQNSNQVLQTSTIHQIPNSQVKNEQQQQQQSEIDDSQNILDNDEMSNSELNFEELGKQEKKTLESYKWAILNEEAFLQKLFDKLKKMKSSTEKQIEKIQVQQQNQSLINQQQLEDKFEKHSTLFYDSNNHKAQNQTINNRSMSNLQINESLLMNNNLNNNNNQFNNCQNFSQQSQQSHLYTLSNQSGSQNSDADSENSDQQNEYESMKSQNINASHQNQYYQNKEEKQNYLQRDLQLKQTQKLRSQSLLNPYINNNSQVSNQYIHQNNVKSKYNSSKEVNQLNHYPSSNRNSQKSIMSNYKNQQKENNQAINAKKRTFSVQSNFYDVINMNQHSQMSNNNNYNNQNNMDNSNNINNNANASFNNNSNNESNYLSSQHKQKLRQLHQLFNCSSNKENDQMVSNNLQPSSNIVNSSYKMENFHKIKRYFAVQFQVANSQFIKNAAILAAGPYWNGKGDFDFSQKACKTQPDLIDLDVLYQYMENASSAQQIDNLENLENSNIFVLISGNDTTVFPEVSFRLIEQYQHYGAQVKQEIVENCEHTFPTNGFGNQDPLYKGSPFISNCNYDGAYNIFKNVVQLQKVQSDKKMNELNFFKFDQEPFSLYGSVMSKNGYLYVPTNCQDGNKKCQLHVAFHGCRQNPDYIGHIYARNTGLNDYAESNDIIILYPQVGYDEKINFNSCWDYWGYSGQEYALKSGKQNQSVLNMILGQMLLL
ncbi:hypothetical protein PPERSA_06654 [Pseudocohnilembus persalinus]|uniref:Uncharacterized protein n=1 Tax=Pseudocohnilembus persalinus TaxID=266149 RepID=A0A0V0QS27_PSEPJ|nr:hypothetical protein PPERSA_06654 [Pseudocohnilembus persalinus]|eukprot:KRX05020.1 hypothetical protein PPERSA_06654 [Pseudocohnilembus persalinus]